MDRPKLLVILGPTATGKSDLAVRLAKKFGGEVVSADSRQVYKGLNLGTGKITTREMRGIRHHLLDVTSPSKIFSAAEYKQQAEHALSDILKRDKLPIIAGGTGFYIDTVVNDASLPAVPANPILRKRLSKKAVGELFALLKKKDPRRAGEIDPKNPHRLVRALEIVETLGRVPRKNKKVVGEYDALYIGLNFPADKLKKKIGTRVVTRMKKGMVAEARRLHAQGLSYRRMRGLGLEYRYLADLLEKKMTNNEFIEQLSSAIWKYTRRQMTWFKHNKKIQWFSPTDNKKIEVTVRAFLTKK